jgi:hypothetical protein
MLVAVYLPQQCVCVMSLRQLCLLCTTTCHDGCPLRASTASSDNSHSYGLQGWLRLAAGSCQHCQQALANTVSRLLPTLSAGSCQHCQQALANTVSNQQAKPLTQGKDARHKQGSQRCTARAGPVNEWGLTHHGVTHHHTP